MSKKKRSPQRTERLQPSIPALKPSSAPQELSALQIAADTITELTAENERLRNETHVILPDTKTEKILFESLMFYKDQNKAQWKQLREADARWKRSDQSTAVQNGQEPEAES
jgi:hypothetical protein